MNKFKKGQVVLYQNGERNELGIVKEVIEVDKRYAQRQDGINGEPTGKEYTAYCYRVWYHTGDTTALTDESLLKPITNDYAFQIIRIDVNNEIQTQKARQIANKLIEEVIEPKTGESVDSERYYEFEDEITKIIETFKASNSE